MLFTVDEKKMTRVPHGDDVKAIVRSLGDDHAAQVREALVAIVDGLEPDADRGTRTFSSSHLGSKLTPWPYPLAHLYDLAREMEGQSGSDEAVEARAGLIFGLFVWESIMERDEKWIFYDPNLSSSDPNREITGKVYFESDS
jgi:hypothetical protein